MHRTFRYPLHPTPAQEAILSQWLGVCCDLYNAALQERRDAWRLLGKSVTRYDQQKSLTQVRAEDTEVAAMSAWALRSALDRLDGAFKGFFRRVKAGAKPGFPRWRAKRRYDSFAYPATAKHVINGSGRSARLHVPILGAVKVNAYRLLQGVPKTVTIRRDSTGRWWACIVCDLGEAPAKPSPTAPIGIDIGLTTLVALSTGDLVPNPRHAERAAAKLARRQQAMARRKRGSRMRERARVLVAKTHAHIANQRLDHARKTASSLVSRFDLIAMEDLNISGLCAGMLSKSVNNAGWRVLQHAIVCKAESAGKHVVFVDPRHTSQLCSACGQTVSKDLAERVHRCDCGYVADRDVNAARNILQRGLKDFALGTSVVSDGAKTPKARREKKSVNAQL